jgi:serine/threonine protein kinase
MAIQPSISHKTATLQDLHALVKDGGDKGRIAGKRDKTTGEIKLYVKPHSAGLWSRLTGKAKERREAAAEGLKEMFDRFKDEKPEVKRSLFNDVKKLISDRVDSKHAVRAGGVRAFTKAVKDAGKNVEAEKKPSNTGPKLAQLGDTFDVARFASDLHGAVTGNGNTTSDDLANAIVTAFKGQNPSQAELKEFALSNGEGFKTELLSALKLTVPNHADAFGGPEASTMLNEAFHKAASDMLPDKVIVNNNANGQPQLPSIKVGGTDYHYANKKLGSGGLGDVFLYQDNAGSKIAFKLLKDGDAEDLAEHIDAMRTEYDAHMNCLGGGHNNVLGLKGVVKMPDGRIGLALEIAPNGDAFDFAVNLSQHLANGALSNEEADVIRLTMLQDMIEGMRHIQEDQRMIHLDFKPPNCMISANGMVKIADFGTTRAGTSIALSNVPDEISNPQWKSSELLKAETEAGKTSANKANAFAENLKKAFPKIENKRVNDITRPIRQHATDKAKAAITIGNQTDTWSLGISAINIFTGDTILNDEKFDSDREARIRGVKVALGQPGPDGKLPEGSLAKKTGNPGVDNLINSLLDPDPNRRPSFTDALQAAVFSTPGVGSPQARDLLIALALPANDPNKQVRIDQARLALFNLTTPLPPLPPQMNGPLPQPGQG